VAVAAGKRQVLWLEAGQQRIDITTSMLSKLRSIRLAGFSERVYSRILDMRRNEVIISKYRRCLVAMVTLGESEDI
jgi:hypothetical protein